MFMLPRGLQLNQGIHTNYVEGKRNHKNNRDMRSTDIFIDSNEDVYIFLAERKTGRK